MVTKHLPSRYLIAYEVTRQDGSILPHWLTFNEDTQILGGTPTNADVETINISFKFSDASTVTPIVHSFNVEVKENHPP